jgi:hypothetical protein
MPTKFAKPPRQSSEELKAGVSRYQQHRLTSEMALSMPESTEIDLAHSIYFASLIHIQSGVGLQYARAKVWRYFLKPNVSGETMAVEVNVRSGSRHACALFTEASVVKEHRDLLRSCSDEASAKGNFEFRMLKVPSIHVFAIWLRGKRKALDILIPLVPKGHFLDNEQPYPRSVFEDLMQEEALKRRPTNPNSN